MGCTAAKELEPILPNFDLNFDSPHVEDEDKILYDLIDEAIQDSETLLESLRNYANGCEEPIRKALDNSDAEMNAWKSVLAAVEKQHAYFQFSLRLEKIWPQLLDKICAGEDSGTSIINHMALTKQLAEIFNFVFRFDEVKMVTPAIQNDFSYYRRVVGAMRGKDKDAKSKIVVDEELANRMSFFYAYPTPMMKVMIDATKDFNANTKDRLIDSLSMVTNICLKALQHDDPIQEKRSMLYLCAMTGCIILVDHMHDLGAFHKKSPIKITNCIATLKNHDLYTGFLLNSLRFTTIHLNSEQTLSAITKLLS